MKKDIALLNSINNKNLAAFNSFYNQYAPAFYGHVRRVLNQHHSADEVLTNSFVTIWNKMEEYDSSKERLFTWSLKLVQKEACRKKVDLVLTELFACQNFPVKQEH